MRKQIILKKIANTSLTTEEELFHEKEFLNCKIYRKQIHLANMINNIEEDVKMYYSLFIMQFRNEFKKLTIEDYYNNSSNNQ